MKKRKSSDTVTIYDVAEKAGVSLATVSRVMNEEGNVRPETRDRVLGVVRELGYRPNAVASGLASRKSTTVGVIIPDITNIYYASLARGIDDIASMYQYNIILSNGDESKNKVDTVVNAVLARQVDGIVFMAQHIADSTRKLLEHSKKPVVLAGTVDPEEQFESVNIDYVAAVKEAVGKLIQNGNQQVAFVSGSLADPINSRYRLKGYQAALNDAQIPYDESLVFETEHSYRAGEAIWNTIRRSGATAAYVTDDELAVGLANSAQDDHFTIPDDFEIITSNNTMLTEISRPKLTSIDQPLYDIGAVAMRMLTKKMKPSSRNPATKLQTMNNDGDQKTVLLPHNIVYRHSTKR